MNPESRLEYNHDKNECTYFCIFFSLDSSNTLFGWDVEVHYGAVACWHTLYLLYPSTITSLHLHPFQLVSGHQFVMTSNDSACLLAALIFSTAALSAFFYFPKLTFLEIVLLTLRILLPSLFWWEVCHLGHNKWLVPYYIKKYQNL